MLRAVGSTTASATQGKVRNPGGGRGGGNGRGASGGGAGGGTWDPANKAAGVTLSGGNLVATLSASGGGTGGAKGTVVYSSGKRYFEVTVSAASTELAIGCANAIASTGNPPGSTTDSYGYYAPNGRGYYNGSFTFVGASYTVGDVIGVMWESGTITFYKNGTLQGSVATGITGSIYPMAGNALGATPQVVCTINTGATAFGNLPSGASAWG